MSSSLNKACSSWLSRNGLGCAIFWLLACLPAFADQSVSLTWNASSDPNAVGYKIYYGGTSGVYTNTVVLGTTTSVTVGGLTEGATYYFTATTVSASGIESSFCNEATYVIPQAAVGSSVSGNTTPPASLPPTLDAIANQSVYQNAGVQTVNLTGIAAGTSGNATVNVYAVASDYTIVSNLVVNYNAPDSTGTLSFSPVGAVGAATVTVYVDNGGTTNNPVTQTFTVTVTTPPQNNPAPTLDAITNIVVYQNAGLQTIPLTGISSGLTGGYQQVDIWAYSSDATILPDPTVNYTSPNNSGTLTFTPVTGALGTATVSIKVNNGSANIVQTFTVTVVPAPVVASQPPTLDAVTNMVVYQNAGTQTISLTGITSSSTDPNQTLTVTAASSNPGVITAPVVNYTSPNTSGTLTFAPVKNALGRSVVTITVNNGNATNNTISRTFGVTVVSQPPTLNPIADVAIVQGTLSQNITLTGISSGSTTSSHSSVGNQSLKITAVSSNSRLIMSPMIRYFSPAASAVLTLRPFPNATGTATVTVTISSGNNTTQQTFTVNVVANQPPTLDPVTSMTIPQDAGTQTITLTGITSGSPTENQNLTVSATSSNPRLISLPTVHYKSPANTATLTFKPLANFIGTATITVTVNDGSRNNNLIRQHFTVTVVPAGGGNTISPAVSSTPGNASQQASAAILTALPHAAGQFNFQLTGTTGAKYAVQATADLVHWTTITTNTAPFTFQDSTVGTSSQRFYRAVSVQ